MYVQSISVPRRDQEESRSHVGFLVRQNMQLRPNGSIHLTNLPLPLSLFNPLIQVIVTTSLSVPSHGMIAEALCRVHKDLECG